MSRRVTISYTSITPYDLCYEGPFPHPANRERYAKILDKISVTYILN